MKQFQFIRGGADPEFFVINKGEPMSVEGLLGGTKYEPKPMEGLPEGFAMQEDNVAAEYNVPAATSAAEFAYNIQTGLFHIKDILKAKGLDIAVVSAMHFYMDQLSTMQAKTLGCEPDWNIWLNKENLRPTPPPTLRTAAAHAHFGWHEPDREQQIAFGKMCDLHLGVPSVLATEPNERRSLYGKAGAVRFKPYGLEYRVLDNFWIANLNQSAHIFNTGVNIASKLNSGGELLMDEVDRFHDEIQVAINTHNRDWALELMQRFEVAPFPKVNNKKGTKDYPGYSFRIGSDRV